MIVVFVVAMIAGFGLGVRVMISGVLRAKPAHSGGSALAVDRVAIGRPVLAVIGTAFGLAGVTLTRVTSLGLVARVGVAGVLAALAAILAVVVIRRWARASDAAPPSAEDDPRFALQGLPARVTRPIGAGVLGEVEYEVDGRRQVTPARSVDAAPIAVDVEVIIERVDRGVTWVEPWAQVEQRM